MQYTQKEFGVYLEQSIKVHSLFLQDCEGSHVGFATDFFWTAAMGNVLHEVAFKFYNPFCNIRHAVRL